jgi:hypothetical protein
MNTQFHSPTSRKKKISFADQSWHLYKGHKSSIYEGKSRKLISLIRQKTKQEEKKCQWPLTSPQCAHSCPSDASVKTSLEKFVIQKKRKGFVSMQPTNHM